MRGKIFTFTKHNTWLIILVCLGTVLSIAASIILGKTIDVLLQHTAFDTSFALFLGATFVLSIASMLYETFVAQFLPLKKQLELSMEYTRGVAKKILSMSQEAYDDHDAGYYLNVNTSSAFTCADVYAQINIRFIAQFICGLLILGATAYIYPLLTIIFVLYVPLFYLCTVYPTHRIAQYQQKGLPFHDKFLDQIKFLIENKSSVNMNRSDAFFMHRYDKVAQGYLRFIARFKLLEIIMAYMPQILACCLQLVCMIFAAYHYFLGALSIGSVIIIFQLVKLYQSPLEQCFNFLIHRKINMVHLDRLASFEGEEEKRPRALNLCEVQDSQEVLHLSNFAMYGDVEHTQLLFSAGELAVKQNECVLIKGANGSGKSQLMKLLSGFNVGLRCSGTYRVATSLRKALYLHSPSLLISGSFEDNLFGITPNPELFEVLGIDFQDKIIEGSTPNLSLGEQQKINLLRALSYPNDTLILDEPFTNLDAATVKRIVAYLQRIKGTKTIFVIDHSAKLHALADHILMISDKQLLCK